MRPRSATAAWCKTPPADCRERPSVSARWFDPKVCEAVTRDCQSRAVIEPGCGPPHMNWPGLPRTARERRQRIRRLARAEFVMHQAVNAAVDLRLIGRLVHRRQVVRIKPVLL